ncbi:glycosyltransferase [bacterium]|nr:glycosyltransferase [bacterium]
MSSESLAVVLPIFNEEPIIPVLFERLDKLKETILPINLQVIAVDDGSSDRSFIELKKAVGTREWVSVIRFSRNFGHQIAVSAGIDHVQVLQQMPEQDRFLRGMVSWVGFRQTAVEFERDVRYAGVTKYPLHKMIRFAMDGIISFSTAPLRMATVFGFTVSLFALLYIIVILILKFTGHTFPGYASIMVAVLFLGGVQLITIGILGEYIGRIHTQNKQRPLYIVSDLINPANEPK